MIQILINQLDFFVFFKNKQFEITVDSILEFMLFLEMNTGLIFPNNEHRISLKTQIISNLKSIKKSWYKLKGGRSQKEFTNKISKTFLKFSFDCKPINQNKVLCENDYTTQSTFDYTVCDEFHEHIINLQTKLKNLNISDTNLDYNQLIDSINRKLEKLCIDFNLINSFKKLKINL